MKHLNNPLSGCSLWIDYLEAAQNQIGDNNLPTPQGTPALEESTHPLEGFSVSGHVPHDELLPNEGTESIAGSDPQTIIEHFPGAATSFGLGTTFLDLFNEDPYASQRVHNLYFPFKSKDEWQLVRFLLRCRLTMQEVDEFVNLHLVRYFPNYAIPYKSFSSMNRSNPYNYPSILQRICVHVWKSFHQVHDGMCKHSVLRAILLKHQLICITATQLIVLHHCMGILSLHNIFATRLIELCRWMLLVLASACTLSGCQGTMLGQCRYEKIL